jgi:hypothetical protein
MLDNFQPLRVGYSAAGALASAASPNGASSWICLCYAPSVALDFPGKPSGHGRWVWSASAFIQGKLHFEASTAGAPKLYAPNRRLQTEPSSHRPDCPERIQEAIMSHWHDTMVETPKTDGAVYVMGCTISGLAALGTIFAVWIFAI